MKLPSTDELAHLAPQANAPLDDVQNWMMSLLRHKRDLSQSEEMRHAAALHFTGSQRLSPSEQIDIYRQQFWLRHTSVLIDDFPGLSALLGQSTWEKIAESFLSQRGYSIFSLSDFGAEMPLHLASRSDLENRDLYVDMARLECAYEKAFTASDDEPLSGEKIAAIPPAAWAKARFQTSHSLHLIEVSYPVAHMRRQLRRDPKSLSGTKTFKQEPANIVVYRRERTLYDKKISTPAFLLLTEFQKGTSLITACEKVIAQCPEAEVAIDEELSSWFGLWGRLGWITDVIISD